MPGPLVTGAAGFAGSHLVRQLLRSEPAVTAWSNPGGQSPATTDARIAWRAVDLLDASAVREAIQADRPSVVYHCAGYADAASAWRHPELALRVNAVGTQHLLDAVWQARRQCPVLVTGSALVYRASPDALSEEAPIGPSSPYGLSKLAQELLTLQSAISSPFLVRPFNHGGPGQSAAYVTSAFAMQIAQAEAGLIAPILRVGNLDSKRDLTDVRDVVRAYVQVIAAGRPRRPYNVCSGVAYRVGDLLEMLLGMGRVRLAIETDPERGRPSDNAVVLGDRSRIGAEVGWVPEIPVEQTLADLLESWRRRLAHAPQ